MLSRAARQVAAAWCKFIPMKVKELLHGPFTTELRMERPIIEHFVKNSAVHQNVN